MGDSKGRLVIDDLRGGRNGADDPWAIKDTECADAVNVDFFRSRLGRKRGGLDVAGMVNTTFTGTISSLFRHVPGTDETLAELWAVDDAATPIINRLAGGTTWSTPTIKDVPTGNGWDVTSATINGKLFLAYKSAVDRLHCWDPVSNSIRRTGLAAPAAGPTLANTGAGAYAAVQRFYRQRNTEQRSGITVRRSEPSAASNFVPSGAGAALRVTQATVVNEGETHWEIEAGIDGVTFYRIATVAIGTTFYDDSQSPYTYDTGVLSALTGTYQLQKSYKFIAADQARILGFGNWVTTNKQDDIELSAVIGSLDVFDEERVDTTTNYRLGLDENDSGSPTGLCGPVFGTFFAFKDRQIWHLTSTGAVAQPYRAEAISKSIGAISFPSICRADDKRGNAALYWMSHRGAYRWSLSGLEYLGRNMEDYVLGPTATVNLSATKRVAVTVYHADKRQVWFWWATGSSNDPNTLNILDINTDGWTRVPSSDPLANTRCAVMFSKTIGAAMSRDLKPYLGPSLTPVLIWRADSSNVTDNGAVYQSYIVTKAYEPGGPGFYGEIGDSILLAKALTAATITDTVTGDFGLTTKTGTALLTAVGSETRVTRVFEGTGLAEDVSFVQHQVGDATALAAAWSLDRLVLPFTKHDPVSG